MITQRQRDRDTKRDTCRDRQRQRQTKKDRDRESETHRKRTSQAWSQPRRKEAGGMLAVKGEGTSRITRVFPGATR